MVEHKTDSLEGVVWIGKDLFQEWDLKECRKQSIQRAIVSLEVLKDITEEQLDYAMSAAEKSVLALSETPVVLTEGLTSEQQRSIVNQKVVCKCGTTRVLDAEDASKSGKSKVLVGNKRRMRCKECAGCKATKCNECQNCLKPHLKKPCVRKVCLFPVVPKCPCFA